MKYSIIIPVYNVAPYLDGCLESVLASCSRIGKDQCEIICVNDGSTDGSSALLERFKVDNSDWRILVVHQNNHGLGYSRNVGLVRATGEYVLFVDSDDEIHLGLFQFLDGIVNTVRPDLIHFGHKTVVEHSAKDRTLLDMHLAYCKYDMGNADQAFESLMRLGSLFAWSALFKRSTIAALRFENITPGEDVLFTTQFVLAASKVVITDAPLYCYLKRPGSLMNKKRISVLQVRSATYATRRQLELLRQSFIFSRLSVDMVKTFRNIFMGQVREMLKNIAEGERENAFKIYYDEGLLALKTLPNNGGWLLGVPFRLKSSFVLALVSFICYDVRVFALKFLRAIGFRKARYEDSCKC